LGFFVDQKLAVCYNCSTLTKQEFIMSYTADAFVNKNNYNYEIFDEAADEVEMFETFPALFVAENNIVYDTRNDAGDPVFVYEIAGLPVAWYDCENQVGFVA
jgi:hypothetical protein